MPSALPAPCPLGFRRTLGAVASVALTLGLAGAVAVAAPAGAKGKAPVQLDGKVNNKGTGTVKNGKVDIEADNFYFQKTFLKGSAGDVTVEIENEGSVPHSFTIDDQDMDEVIQPGKKAKVTVTLSAGEPVNFYCKFHVSSGMQGALYTGAGGTASGTGAKSSGAGSSGGYDYG
jgi:plastocyanin